MSNSTPSAGPSATPAVTSSHAPAYYAIIPAHVRYDDSLPPNAKLLYGEITALCSAEGFCWAKNAYFAALYGVKVRAVQRWIEALEAAGHILVEPIDGYQRHIRLPESERAARVRKGGEIAPVKKDMGVCQKRHPPMSKMTCPPVKNDTHSITESITKKKTKNSEGSPAASPEKSQKSSAACREKTPEQQAVIRAGAARLRDALEAAEKRKKETSGPP